MKASGSEPRKLRVLLMAELCNPAYSSGPLLGFRHYHALCELADVHLVTNAVHREHILAAGIKERDVTFIDLRMWEGLRTLVREKIYGGDHGPSMLTVLTFPLYYAFEMKTWWKFRAAIRAGSFDVVHRLTPVNQVFGSPLATFMRNLPVPFTLGPINGGLKWPKGYEHAQQDKEFIFNLRVLYKAMPFSKGTLKHAAAILVGSSDNWRQVPERYHAKSFFIPENGIRREDVLPDPRPALKMPLKVTFIGRLVALKNPGLVVSAAAPFVREGRMTLDLIGEGPERAHLESLVQTEGLSHAVTFFGQVSYKRAMELLERGDVLAFPSVKEFGGGVVIESMAKGLVPIVMNYGGPGDLVSDDFGYRLPLENAEATTGAMQRVFTELLADPRLVREKGEAARQYVLRHLTWEAKVRKTAQVLRHVAFGELRPTLPPPALLSPQR